MNINKLNEKLKIALNEMAIIAEIKNPLAILVYSDDHQPPHFHIAKINISGIRIKIPNRPFNNTYELKKCILEEDQNLISTYQKYFGAVVDILKNKSARKSAKRMNNLEV